MLSLEAALDRVVSGITPLPGERVPLHTAAGRWLAQEVISPRDLPAFDNSAMDGYAVQSAALAQASLEKPFQLSLRGETPAGHAPGELLVAGECRRIFTGAPLPPGADAVVMQEDTRMDPAAPGVVFVLDAVRPWDHVRFRGEDVKMGMSLARAGDRLNFAMIALLGAVGIREVSATRRPKVALLATGSELVEPGGELVPGQIFESNRSMIEALARETGCETVVLPIVADDLPATRAAIAEAFAVGDVVITTGGVSVGAHDFVKEAFEALGGDLAFWKVAIRPGKPFAWGRLQGRHFFGLPGNPVSAAVTFLLLVRPALIRLQGGNDGGLPTALGTLTTTLRNPGERRHFVRVKMDRGGQVTPVGQQGSHILSGLVAAQGLVDVPPGAVWESGRPVEVLRFP